MKSLINKISIDLIQYKNVEITFNHTYDLFYYVENENYWLKDDYLDITCIGKNLNELLENFYDDFIFIYNEYVLDDNNLSSCALKLKGKLKDLVKEYKFI